MANVISACPCMCVFICEAPTSIYRISYTETHIPLQKGIDDCVVGDGTTDINPGNHGSPAGAVAMPMTSTTTLTRMEQSSNPDLIPVQGESINSLADCTRVCPFSMCICNVDRPSKRREGEVKQKYPKRSSMDMQGVLGIPTMQGLSGCVVFIKALEQVSVPLSIATASNLRVISLFD
jgi:hypothetical protein